MNHAYEGIKASNRGEMRVWEGSVRATGWKRDRPALIRHYEFHEAVHHAIEFSRVSQYTVGTRSEITGHPKIANLPDEVGIWTADTDYTPISRIDGEDAVLIPPDPPKLTVTKMGRRVIVSATDDPKHCLCGCGAEVRRRFLPGHDMRLKSRLINAAKANEKLDPPFEDGTTDPWEIAGSLGWLGKLPARS